MIPMKAAGYYGAISRWKELVYIFAYMTMHSPSVCFLMLERDTRALDLGAPPRRKSSSRSRALGKF